MALGAHHGLGCGNKREYRGRKLKTLVFWLYIPEDTYHMASRAGAGRVDKYCCISKANPKTWGGHRTVCQYCIMIMTHHEGMRRTINIVA